MTYTDVESAKNEAYKKDPSVTAGSQAVESEVPASGDGGSVQSKTSENNVSSGGTPKGAAEEGQASDNCQNSEEAAPKKKSSFVVRVISSLFMIGSAAWLISLGSWYFSALVGVISVGLTYEYCNLAQKRGFKPNHSLTAACSLAMTLVHHIHMDTSTSAWLCMAILFWCLFGSSLGNVFDFKDRGSAIADSAINCMAVIYCGLLPAFLISIRNIHVFVLIFLVLVCIATDAGAYLFGKVLGRSKLCPQVSPGKTWAGFWGALICAVFVAYGCDAMAPRLGYSLQFNMYFWLVLGLGIGLMGQLGDLFESSLKRDAGVKDASDIIPGHGGLLDRFDSYLFASMFTYLSIAICVSIPFLSELFTK